MEEKNAAATYYRIFVLAFGIVDVKRGGAFYSIFKVCDLFLCSKDDLQVVMPWP